MLRPAHLQTPTCQNGGMSDQLPPNDNRDWTPVAPPHPYGAAGATQPGSAQPGSTPPQQPQGRAFAITAMGLGLAALLTVIVSALYFSDFVAIGAGIGVVAAVVGIVALVQRHAPRVASITGIAAAAAAVLVAAVVFGMHLGGSSPFDTSTGSGAEASDDSGAQDGSGDRGTGDEASGDADADTDTDTDTNATDPALMWPANFATGGFHFTQGEDGPQLLRSDPLDGNTAPQPADVNRAEGPADFLLYVDYRCPHCFDFEAANIERIQQLVTDGLATIEIRPMAFVSDLSPALSGAMMCVAQEQPDDAWQAHTTLLGPDVQNLTSLESIVEALDAGVGGLDGASSSCIADLRFAQFAQAVGQWYTMSPVPHSIDPDLQVRGTPLAVVNGVPYTGMPADKEAFEVFLSEQSL